MSWIPAYHIEGGMMGGLYCPQGVLDGLLTIATTSTSAIDQGVRSLGYNYATGEADGALWSAAYGVDDSRLEAYQVNNEGSSGDPLIAEILIENPEGAQFYKQTFCVFGHLSNSVVQDTGYKLLNCSFTITKVTRREYAAPYSMPTETHVFLNQPSAVSIGGGHYYVLMGTPAQYGNERAIKRIMFTMGSFIYDSTEYFGVALYDEDKSGVSQKTSSFYALFGVSKSVLDNAFGSFDPETKDDPNEETDEPGGGESGEGGGDGGHNKEQDAVPYPDDPPLSGASAGFITMYEMTETNMQNFATELFDFDWWQAVKNFFADPMDFICGVMIVPFAPRTSGHARPVFHQASPLPDIKMSHFWPVIQDQYQDIDCGSITIPKYYNSCFDYNPYTSVRIFLPYIGYKDLDPDEVMGNTISLKYKVDCMTGDCIAFIMRTAISMPSMTPKEQVIAQFSGNMGVRVAFGRQSFDSAIQASVQLMTGIAGGIIKGAGSALSAMSNMGGSVEDTGLKVLEGAAQAGGSIAAAMPNVESMKSQVLKSGIMGANAGYMGVQKPFIIRSVPNQSRPSNYRELNGYPSNIAGPIGSRGFRGYMELEKIELDGVTAMEQEVAEIQALVMGGVLYGNA